MKTLSDHLIHPHLSSDLPFSSLQMNFKGLDYELSLSLSLDSKGRILRFVFKEKNCPYLWLLSVLTEKLSGLPIDDLGHQWFYQLLDVLKQEAHHQNLHLPFALEPYPMVIEMIMGLKDVYTGKDTVSLNDRILCRCFGVRESEVIKIIKNNKLTKLVELQRMMKISLACRECEGVLQKYFPTDAPTKNALVCRCKKIYHDDLVTWVKNHKGATFEDMKDETGVATGCGSCKDEARGYLDYEKSSAKQFRFKNYTNAEWIIKIQEVMKFHFSYQPILKGSTFEILSFKMGVVRLSLMPKPVGDKEWEICQMIDGLIKQDVDLDIQTFFF